MYPIIGKIGPFPLQSYGLMLVIAFALSIWLASKEAEKNRLIAPSKVIDIGLLMLVSGMVGSKLLYILLNLPSYKKDFWDATLWRSGFVFFGGLILALISVFFYARRNKLSFFQTADFFIPYLALGQAIGRIGCFLNGCCYGKPTELLWGVSFPLDSPAGYHFGVLSLHPTQLYSALNGFILFLILNKVKSSRKFAGEVLLLYFLCYFTFRFLIEFLRGDSLSLFFSLTLFQWISVGIFFTALPVFLSRWKRSRR